MDRNRTLRIACCYRAESRLHLQTPGPLSLPTHQPARQTILMTSTSWCLSPVPWMSPAPNGAGSVVPRTLDRKGCGSNRLSNLSQISPTGPGEHDLHPARLS